MALDRPFPEPEHEAEFPDSEVEEPLEDQMDERLDAELAPSVAKTGSISFGWTFVLSAASRARPPGRRP
jgi:hypothetical protein